MKNTKIARKIDAMGRITIPSQLRKQLGISIGEMYSYNIYELDGATYLCIECPNAIKEKTDVEKAIEFLTQNGFEIK